MKHVVFVCNTVIDGREFRHRAMGGLESAVVQLAEALAARGNTVTVLTAKEEPLEFNGVSWRPLHESEMLEADLVVANGTAGELRYVKAKRQAIWLHCTYAFDKFLRKGDVLTTLYYRPAGILFGRHHQDVVSRLIPYYPRLIIPHGVGEPFTTAAPAETTPPPRAIHFSQPYRDSQNLVRIWVEAIHPKVPGAEFHMFTGDWRPEGFAETSLAESGIVFRDRVSKDGLVEEMRRTRVTLYRGHKDETFCLAAAESTAMGVPVVTAGIGALKERVRHGETGLIGPSDTEFAEAAVRVLTDDELWSRMHDNGLATRGDNSWDAIAAMWEEKLLN